MKKDESFFLYDSKVGSRFWMPVGKPGIVPWTGSHKKIVAYGAIAHDGRQLFKTYARFDGESYVDYLKTLHCKFGKILVIADRAPQHRSAKVKNYLRSNDAVRQRYLQRGFTHLNAVEECWHQAKRDLLVSRYYSTFAIMHQTVSEYFRTKRFHLEIVKYFSRKIPIRKDF